MPVYEYECENCGTRFERIQSIHDEPIRQCPHCGNPTLHKVFHPVGLIFKGSGWYVTDSRKSSNAVTGEGKTGPTDAAAKEVANRQSRDPQRDPAVPQGATPSGEKKTPATETKKKKNETE